MRTWVPRSLPAGSAAGHPHRLLVSRLGTRTPAERRENAARYLALQVVGLLYHADVRVGAQADFAHNGEVGAAFQALGRGSRLGLVGPRVLQGNISTRHTCRTTAAWARGMGPVKSRELVIFLHAFGLAAGYARQQRLAVWRALRGARRPAPRNKKHQNQPVAGSRSVQHANGRAKRRPCLPHAQWAKAAPSLTIKFFLFFDKKMAERSANKRSLRLTKALS